ncbi:MAG: MFS transporter [Acidimicrobiales bacterium]
MKAAAPRSGRLRIPRRPRPALGAGLVLAFALFVMLGMPEGTLGAAWPSMRLDVGRPVSSLAWLVVGYTVGYLLATAGSGWLLEWFGIDRVLITGVAGTAIGVAGFAASPWWLLLVAVSFVTGAGAGTVDSTLNTFVAITGGARAMNLLHAFFGVGATLGPLAVTAALRTETSWRAVYAIIAVVEVVLLVVVWARRDRFRIMVRPTADVRAADGDAADGDAAGGKTADGGGAAGGAMPLGLLGLMLLFFAAYVAAEVSLGQWSYSLLVDERDVSATVAGWAIAGYWGGLTLGRFALAFVGSAIEPLRILRIASAATVAGVTLFWLDPVPGLDLVSLPVVGLAQAGMFPAMVLLTPGWIGRHNTGRAVGLQLMASSAGAIGASVAIGAAVQRWDLEAMPPIIVALTVTTLLAFTAAARLAARPVIAAPV